MATGMGSARHGGVDQLMLEHVPLELGSTRLGSARLLLVSTGATLAPTVTDLVSGSWVFQASRARPKVVTQAKSRALIGREFFHERRALVLHEIH